MPKQPQLNPQQVPAFIHEAFFKCEEVQQMAQPLPIPNARPGTPQNVLTQFVGAIIAKSNPIQGAAFENFTLYGIHFLEILIGLKIEPVLTLKPNNVQHIVHPSKTNRQKSLPVLYNDIPNFDVVFFHPSELTHLTTFHGKKQQLIHVSRAIIDYGNGKKYQTLKMRPDPDPVAQAFGGQRSDVAYLIGNSCPPDWKKGQAGSDPSFVTSILYEGENKRITKSMLPKLLVQDYVLFDPKPEE